MDSVIWFGVIGGGVGMFAWGYALGRMERRDTHHTNTPRVLGSREFWRRLEQEEQARRWTPGNE